MSESVCPHWHAEVERLRVEAPGLAPAAKAALRDVLEAVIAEDSLESVAADSARSLLASLRRDAPPASSPAPGPSRRRAGLRLSRGRAPVGA